MDMPTLEGGLWEQTCGGGDFGCFREGNCGLGNERRRPAKQCFKTNSLPNLLRLDAKDNDEKTTGDFSSTEETHGIEEGLFATEEKYQSIHYCRHCLLLRHRKERRTRRRRRHHHSASASFSAEEDPKEWERRGNQHNEATKSSSRLLLYTTTFVVAFSTLPFLTLAPSLLSLPDPRSPCLLVATLHLSLAIAATASTRWQHDSSSYLYITTACLSAVTAYLCLHLAGASLNASVAANVFLGCILAPAQVSRLKRLLTSDMYGRELPLSRFIFCSSPGGLPSSLVGGLLILLSATLGAHPTTTSIAIGSGHQSVESFPEATSFSSSWLDAASPSSSPSSWSAGEQSAGDQTNRLGRLTNADEVGEPNLFRGRQQPEKVGGEGLFVSITAAERNLAHSISSKIWQTLLGTCLIIAASALVLSAASTLAEKDFKEAQTKAKEKKKRKSPGLSCNFARFAHILPGQIFLGLQEGFMSRYFYRDSVMGVYGLKYLGFCLVSAGLGWCLSAWLSGHSAQHWRTAQWRRALSGLSCMFHSALLLFMIVWKPDLEDPVVVMAAAFAWGAAAAATEFIILYSFEEEESNDGGTINQVVAARHVGLLFSYGVGGFIITNMTEFKQSEAAMLAFFLTIATACLHFSKIRLQEPRKLHISKKDNMVV